MIGKLRRLVDFRTVKLQIPEIVHETNSGILIEWKSRNTWLPKNVVKINREERIVELELPRWLYDQKF